MAQIDETTADTPSEGSDLSVEDAFFSGNESPVGDVVKETVESAPQEGTTEQGTPLEKNDERRFQYWQSEADKAKNENDALKQQLSQVQNMQAQMMQQQQAAQQKPTQEKEEFPAPPMKPERPAGFNRAEAYEDPSSPSARYVDEVEAWRDNMTEYSNLKNEYQNALVQEQVAKERNARVENIKRAQHQQKVNQQVGQIYQQVQGEYGLNADEAKSFVRDMSKPDSLSMDNLVELWRIKQGSGASVAQQPAQPSDVFNQQQRAQQVASPMGVLPAQQTEQGSSEQSIMDSMISDYKKNNPW